MYRVSLTDEAQRVYASVDRPIAKKLARCFVQLGTEPRRHNNVKQLTGRLQGFFRYRVGDYRVIYAIDDAKRAVTVITIAHRRESYD